MQKDIEKEIIVVDDGSHEPLPAKIDRYIRDNNITLLRLGRNSGLSAARNAGIRVAKHDYIIPLDADDFFEPYNPALSMLEAKLNEGYDIAFGNVVQNGIMYYPQTKPLIKEHFIGYNPIFCSSMFRRRVWQAGPPQHPKEGKYWELSHSHCEDLNFWAKAFVNGFKFGYVNVPVYVHMTRPDSMLASFDNHDKYLELAVKDVF